MNDLKFDWNDVTLVPAVFSEIRSRKEINYLTQDGKLPLFVAPMNTVVDSKNIDTFLNVGFEVCVPRGIVNTNVLAFTSFGLDEIEKIVTDNGYLPKRVLIDIANGHSIRLYEVSKKIKEQYKEIILMVGNVANPKTFEEYAKIGVDYIRLSIGSGNVCTTACNTAIFYPSASLVSECADIKYANNYDIKIVADGGFKTYKDIIMALALGSDYVMLGSMISKSLEACGDSYVVNGRDYVKITKSEALSYFNEGGEIYKIYIGMSTKTTQRSWGRKEEDLRTSEGITLYNKVEYKIGGWVENFSDYLRSAMSYTDKKELSDFIGGVEYVHITQNSFNRFNK